MICRSSWPQFNVYLAVNQLFFNLLQSYIIVGPLQGLINCYGDNIVCLRYNQPPRNPSKKVCVWLPASILLDTHKTIDPLLQCQNSSGSVVKRLTSIQFKSWLDPDSLSFFSLIGQIQEDKTTCWSSVFSPEFIDQRAQIISHNHTPHLENNTI